MTDQVLKSLFTRRHFVAGTGALALTYLPIARASLLDGGTNSGKVRAYVGTNTGKGDNGEGIYIFEVDLITGVLSHRKLAAKTPTPSWIAIHPSRKVLYAVNEVSNFNGSSGSVSSFAIDGASGDLAALNTVSSEGAGPAHLSIDPSGKYAFVANYAGGTIAVLPIEAGGSLAAAVDVHRDSGNLGSPQSASAAPGTFTVGGHEAPHAHMIAPDPANRFVLATDLGQDRIYSYRFDPTAGKLTPSSNPPFVSLPSGDGPRHFVFHPNGHWFYSIQEQASTIVFFHYDANAGSLTLEQSVSTLPPGFAGTSFASEILMSRDGRFIYAANRLHDSVAVFAVAANGRLTRAGEVSTMGDYPRHCTTDPRGNFLYVCNQRGDSITSFHIHRETGLLSFTGQYTPVGSPTCMVFL